MKVPKITDQGFEQLKLLHVKLCPEINRRNFEKVLAKRFSNYYIHVPQQSRYSGNDEKRKQPMKASGE